MAKHARRSSWADRWRLGRGAVAAVGAPVVVLGLLVAGWGVDTYALRGDVVRNVELDGAAVEADDLTELRSEVLRAADELARRPVELRADGATYTATAGDLGLTLDVDATVAAVRDAGRDAALPVRPFRWAFSFVSPHRVDPSFVVDPATTTAALAVVQGGDRTEPVDPTIRLAEDGNLAVVPGTPGLGIDAGAVVDALPGAAAEAEDGEPISLEVPTGALPPSVPDAEAEALVAEANQLTAAPLTLAAAGTTRPVDPVTVRSWLRAVPSPDGGLQLAIDPAAVDPAVAGAFADIVTEPVDARIALEGGGVAITPSQDGVTCCGPDSADRILAAVQGAAPTVELAATVTPPALTTETAQSWGISQPVGGARAWPESGSAGAPAGFTTYHAAGQPRVVNIQRMADIVDGAVIPPGGSFSINDHVGRRTTEGGFVPAGAISNGVTVQEVGGGVSQFATTLFNAAYFAGLDIPTYQAHSEYFSRYPRGREATMGFPAPDLVLDNTTPHGILIDTSYTATSITITMWSTPYAQGEQTGSSEGSSGNCTTVSTTRTRTFVDGRPPVEDTFRATYRPGEGQFC